MSGLPLRVRWHLDGHVFNGPPDEHGREWVIESETGWSSSPPTRNDQTQPRTGAHGGWPPQTYRDPRTIRLDGWVYAPTWEARRDAEHRLAALCAEPDREYPLSCTEELGELVASVAQDDTTLVTIQSGGQWLDFSLQLVAPDPRKYSATEQTVTTGLPADSATGLDFASGDDAGLDFEAVSGTGGIGLNFGPQPVDSTGRATVANRGTADTAPVFTLTGPLVGPVTVTRRDNNASITYRDSIPANDRLVIDTGTKTVLLSTAGSPGSSHRHRAAVIDWHALTVPPRTTVEYVLRHSDVPDTQSRLTVTWRSAWW